MSLYRSEGKVKFFSASLGYGFIIPDDGGAEVFVYQREIIKPGYRTLAEGERVAFDVCQGPKGRYAENVTPL